MIDKLLHSKGVKKALALGVTISLLLLVFSLVYPSMRRADRVERTGSSALASAHSLSTAITYFAGEDLAALRQNPMENDQYRALCGLLARVKDNYGYDRVYAVYKGVGNKYAYLLDAGYRDNATAGVDYAQPGSQFSGAVQSKTRSTLDKVLGGKKPAGFEKSILTTDDHRQVIVSFVPLQDSAGQTIAALVVESPAGNTQFNKLGLVDFNLLAMISGGIFVLLLLLSLSLRSWRKSREAKHLAQEERNAPVVEAEIVQPQQETPPAASADVQEAVQPEDATLLQAPQEPTAPQASEEK